MPVIGRDIQCRPVRLLGEDTILFVHKPGFTEKASRKQFQVKSHLTGKFSRDGTVQIHRNHDIRALSFYPDCVIELKIGIDHRIEAGHMTG